MKLAIGITVLVIVIAWWRWPDLSLPTFGSRHVGAASVASDDDDPVDDADTPAPAAATSKAAAPIASAPRRVLVPTYDPWAGPPPVDPNAPRLPDEPVADRDEFSPGQPWRGVMRIITPVLRACYAEQTPKPTEPLWISLAFGKDSDGRAQVVEVLGPDDKPLPPGFEDCVHERFASVDLPPFEDGRSFKVRLMVQPPPN